MLIRIRYTGESYHIEEQLAPTQPWLLCGVWPLETQAIKHVERTLNDAAYRREDRWDGVYYCVDKLHRTV